MVSGTETVPTEEGQRITSATRLPENRRKPCEADAAFRAAGTNDSSRRISKVKKSVFKVGRSESALRFWHSMSCKCSAVRRLGMSGNLPAGGAVFSIRKASAVVANIAVVRGFPEVFPGHSRAGLAVPVRISCPVKRKQPGYPREEFRLLNVMPVGEPSEAQPALYFREMNGKDGRTEAEGRLLTSAAASLRWKFQRGGR